MDRRANEILFTLGVGGGNVPHIFGSQHAAVSDVRHTLQPAYTGSVTQIITVSEGAYRKHWLSPKVAECYKIFTDGALQEVQPICFFSPQRERIES